MSRGGAIASCTGVPLGSAKRAALDQQATVTAYLGTSINRNALPAELQDEEELGYGEDANLEARMPSQPYTTYRAYHVRSLIQTRLYALYAGRAALVPHLRDEAGDTPGLGRDHAAAQLEGREDRHPLQPEGEGRSRGGSKALQLEGLHGSDARGTRRAQLDVLRLRAERACARAFRDRCAQRQCPRCGTSRPALARFSRTLV